MKKLFISLIIVSVAIIGLRAQEGGSPIVLLNYNTVKKKVEKSNEEIQEPKKNTKPATWVKRGELFQQVFMVGLEQLQEGMASATMVLFYKEPLSIDNETKDGALYETYNYEHMKYTFVNGGLQDWKRIDPIHEDPLRVAMDAYQKALELDEGNKVDSKVKENLIELKLQLKREGVNNYYTSNFDGALKDFENVLEVNNMDLFAGEMDTIMVQYSGIISREIGGKTGNMELYKKAIKYYQQLADVNYGGPNTYLQMKMDYFVLGDTLKGIEILKEAYDKYPDSINVIANIADAYILAKQFDEGIEFMAKVIENNPSIPEAYYWNGRLLINKEDVEYIERAIESYNKAAELNPGLYYIWYDVGYIYYLQGADFYDRGNVEEHEPTRDALLALGKEKYKMSISALEKAYELNNENAAVKYETLDILQRMYYKEQRMEDYERVKALKAEM